MATIRLISIHALHEESDDNSTTEKKERLLISIHALHEESDRRVGYVIWYLWSNFNPRSP